jgi:16S rRNA (cytosine967-C5)-methyltransferase
LRLPDEKKDPVRRLSVEYSVPEWICRLWIEAYGKEKTVKILQTVNNRPSLTLTVNTLKTSPAAFCEALNLAGIKAELSPVSRYSVLLDGAVPISALEPFEGSFFVQDEASALCVAAMGAKAGDRVLDACACPGGKSFGMALSMNNEGSIRSLDLHKNKLSLIETGAEKLGISIIETGVQNASVHNPEMPVFDKILCDVPCSGLGVIAKKPDIRYKSEEDIVRLPVLQAKILETNSAYLKTGGTLVYSTCTINPTENRKIVENFLSVHPEFSLCPFTAGSIVCDGILEILPYEYNTDGFFIAKLCKRASKD